jgi:hypothetical protein
MRLETVAVLFNLFASQAIFFQNGPLPGVPSCFLLVAIVSRLLSTKESGN